jgi:hypothetical protein
MVMSAYLSDPIIITDWFAEFSEARIVFKAGKNRDGYFSCDDLMRQVENAIDIFESKVNGFATGLFAFDNAPSHQK